MERKVRRHCSNPDIICYPNKVKSSEKMWMLELIPSSYHLVRMWFKGHRVLSERYFGLENY